MMSGEPVLRIKRLGLCEYTPVWRDMQAYSVERGADAEDQLWLLEHQPVFTLGMNSKPEHLLDPGDIPVIPIDRGGQVTYHGPGQLVAYVQLDLRRMGIGVRQLVQLLEQSVIDWLAGQGVSAEARRDAPGVYVDGAKIAALGLRVKRGCSYHGLSFNVDMDLEPFSRINPCGYPGLAVTQLKDLGIALSVDEVARDWLPGLVTKLRYHEYLEA
jgi:lipoyl(octanoyl) transferase